MSSNAPSSSRPVRRILVGTDLSVESVGAVLLARWLAETFDATLDVVHCVQPVSEITERAIPGFREIHDQQASEELEKFVASHSIADFANPRLVRGEPAREILRCAIETGADLIVLGSYGESGLEHAQIGGITDRVVRKSPVDVIVARPEHRGPIRRLGVVSECADDAEVEFERAANLAEAFGVDEVVVVRAFEVPSGYHMISSYEDAEARMLKVHEDEARALAEATNARRATPVRFRTRIETGEVVKSVKRIALEEELDLLILSTHSRSAVAELLLSNLSEKILRASPCSVWSEKSEETRQSLLEAVQRLID